MGRNKKVTSVIQCHFLWYTWVDQKVLKLNPIPVNGLICNGCGWPTEDAYSSGHLILSHLGLAFVLMLRPFFSKLVMSTDLLGFEHPSVLLFCFEWLNQDPSIWSICPRENKLISLTCWWWYHVLELITWHNIWRPVQNTDPYYEVKIYACLA